MDAKQRIIGAVVLVSLAIIFLPMILERPHQVEERRLQEIPPEPVVPKFSMEDISRESEKRFEEKVASPRPAEEESSRIAAGTAPVLEAADIADTASSLEAKSPETATVVARTEEKAEKPEKREKRQAPPVEKPVAITEGWAVQVGTFKNRESAYRIRNELMASSDGGFIQDYRNAQNQALVRVFAGPFLDERSAQAAKKRLDSKYKVKSLVVAYRPAP